MEMAPALEPSFYVHYAGTNGQVFPFIETLEPCVVVKLLEVSNQ